MRRFPWLVLALSAYVGGCGRFGYDLLARRDPVHGGALGDGDQSSAVDGGDDTGSMNAHDVHDAAVTGDASNADGGSAASGDGDAGGSANSDAGTPPINPALAACPAPVQHDAPLPLNRYEFARTDTLAEDSISLRHGSLTGATQANGLAELSGTSTSFVQLPSGLISSLSAATIMIWVRWDSGPQNQTIVDFGQSSSNRLQLLASAPGNGLTLRWITATESVQLSGSDFLSIGTTHLLTITLDPAAARIALYLDGSLEASRSSVSFALSNLRDDKMYIGKSNDTENGFKGGIEELRIYNTAFEQCPVLGADLAGFASTTFPRCADPGNNCTFGNSVVSMFYSCQDALDFASAASSCANAGMHLASASSMSENQIAASEGAGPVTWLGANDTKQSGTFAWCDGTLVSYQAWASGEPSTVSGNDCVAQSKSDQSWSARPCSEQHPFVCVP